MGRFFPIVMILAGCSAPAADGFDDLRALPEVTSVQVSGPSGAPKTLIHVRDYHYIPKGLYAKDSGSDRGYEDFLKRVDQIQRQQLAVLRHLIKGRGVNAVFAERLTPESAGLFQQRVQTFQKLNAVLAEARKLQSPKARQLVLETQELIDDGHEDLLDLGAPGRLLIDGDQVEVLPLDDEKALNEAKPKQVGGKFTFDPEKVRVREEAMVRNAFTRGPVAVVILGGAHDLTQKLADCRYARVTVKIYPE
jgi:hypothetical protein